MSLRGPLLVAWFVTRVAFLALWYPAYALGTANVWLKNKWVAAR